MLETLGIAAGQTAINQGVGMLNMELQEEANKRQAEFQHNLDKKMAEYTYNLTNTTAQMDQLRKNNLNPTLALGNGTGGQTVSTGNASTGSVGMIDNKISMQDAQNMALLEAQRKNIEADTKLKEADANKKNGVDTEEAKARIENINAVTVQPTLTPNDPGVKAEFQRIANTPYDEVNYNCLNKSREFHTYILLHDSKVNAYLRTIYHSTGNYAHAFVQWNGQAYDPTNPEWYGVDYQKYLTKMAEEGFNTNQIY